MLLDPHLNLNSDTISNGTKLNMQNLGFDVEIQKQRELVHLTQHVYGKISRSSTIPTCKIPELSIELS